jgi:pimeloyl-ACP methyl ester carboxylesterase
MTNTTAPEMTHVLSPDGTRIGVFVSGHGRPLVVVPGTTSDHTAWHLVSPLLENHVTVHAVDRRGRGSSGDSPPYSLDKEYGDIAAVVDAAAASWGGQVDLLGHSFGGNVAFGAALRTRNVRRLALYEGWPVPDIADRTIAPHLTAELDQLLDQGQPERMLEAFYRAVVHMSDDEIATIKTSAAWPARVAAASTVPREIRAFCEQAFDAASAARITIPVLLMVGSDTPADIKADPDLVAAALPDGRLAVLPGQMHVAHLTDPEGFAAALLSFLAEPD